tara:strand:- start:83 stop:457 length:375 start_codon:yes stop_codon:yes gene_type:complete
MKKIFIIFIYIFLISGKVSLAENLQQQEIYKNLRCLVCQGQSIAESNSDFAQNIKLTVDELTKEGKSDDEIYDFLISRYGEWIVYKPKLNKSNFLLWFMPYMFLIFGGFVIFIALKKRNNSKVN